MSTTGTNTSLRFPAVTSDLLQFLTEKKLSSSAKMVYFALLSHSTCKGKPVWPSRARLGTLVGCAERHVRRLTAELEVAGLIEIELVPGRPSQYSFCPLATPAENVTPDKTDPPVENVRGGGTDTTRGGDTHVPRTNQRTKQRTNQGHARKRLTIEERIAQLKDPELKAYDRTMKGVTGIWIDAFWTSRRVKPRTLSKPEQGQLEGIWSLCLDQTNSEPDAALTLFLGILRSAWKRHKNPKPFPFEDPPRPSDVQRHWDLLLERQGQAAPPPKPELPSSSEFHSMNTAEKAHLSKQIADWEELYGTG